VKKRWIILIVLVLLIAFGWYTFFVPHGSARRKLADYKKELIAKGEKLDLASVAPPHKTDVSNGASEFLRAIANWSNPNDFTPIMRIVAPGAAMVGHRNLDAEARTNYEANRLIANNVRASLKADTLDFGVGYSSLSYTTVLSHLPRIKSAAILLSQTAMQALEANDLQEAAQDLGAEADLMRLWDSEPILISSLVRMVCVRIGVATTWEGLQHAGWTDAQLAELQAKWQRVDLISSLESVVAGERVFGINSMAEARKATKAIQLDWNAIVSGTTSGPSLGEWVDKLLVAPKAALGDAYERYPKFWLWKSKWSYEEELCGLELASAALQAVRSMKLSGFCAPALATMSMQNSNDVRSHLGADRRFMILMNSDGFYMQSIVKAAQAETARRLLVTAIALKRYKLRHDKWPESLGELVPDILEQVPTDFMDGKPLRYKPAPEGWFLLYSVGEDGIDDGGNPIPTPSQSPGLIPIPVPVYSTATIDWLKTRDIVWPQPATGDQIDKYRASNPTFMGPRRANAHDAQTNKSTNAAPPDSRKPADR
jgi:hypothetical protein